MQVRSGDALGEGGPVGRGDIQAVGGGTGGGGQMKAEWRYQGC